MQCTRCHKSLATIHILDLEGGSFIGEQRLCPTCAEAAGYVHPKGLKITSQMLLEDLVGSFGANPGAPFKTIEETCPACGLTAAQFRTRGRLGCPRCYDMFRQSLLPLLERVHDGTTHRGRCPGKPASVNVQDEEHLMDLRSSLQDAIKAENYELAAQLRDQIQKLSPGEESHS